MPQTFISQYQEETTMSHQLKMEGVWEMMSEKHFQIWMAKPKNGSVDPQEASALWQAEFEADAAITDHLGRNPKYARRVAIKKADYVKSSEIYERKRHCWSSNERIEKPQRRMLER